MSNTVSEIMVSRVRDLCHEQTRKAEASPLILAALELATEHEILVERSLVMERVIHESAKDLEKAMERSRRLA